MVEPEILKASLRFCNGNFFCDGCPHECTYCDILAEALEYIERLENELKEDKK